MHNFISNAQRMDINHKYILLKVSKSVKNEMVYLNWLNTYYPLLNKDTNKIYITNHTFLLKLKMVQAVKLKSLQLKFSKLN